MRSPLRLDVLKTRLLAGFFLASVLPVGAVGWLAYRQGEATLKAQFFTHLGSVGESKSQQLDGWLRERRHDVIRPASIPNVRRLAAILTAGEHHPQRHAADRELREILNRIRTLSGFAELFLVEATDGQVVLSTDPEQEGKLKRDRPYFREGLKGPFFQHVYYSLTLGKAVMAFSAPISDAGGRPFAILVGRLDLAYLDRLMAAKGTSGRTFLVNRFNYFVSESLGRGPHGWRPVFSEGVERALAGQTGTALYVNHENHAVVGAYRWLPDLGLGLIAEVDQAEAFAPVRQFGLALIAVLAVVGAAAAVLGIGFSYGISRPIGRLVGAVRAVGRGDLTHRVAIEGPAELAFLASAVNQMADDLSRSRRELEAYSQTLEQRVEERTAESERRRRAAEALAEVTRSLAQTLDPAEVARRVAEGLRSLLGAMATGVFQLDPHSQDLTAMAISGDLGQRSEEPLVVPAGTSVIGLAVRERRPITTPDLLTDPRIVLTADVRAGVERAGYRAGLAVPLLVNDRLIGALGIADREARVFSPEEIQLAQAFADRAALALECARLYDASERRRREAERLALKNARMLNDLTVHRSRLEALLEGSQRLGQIQPVESLLSAIAEACGRLLDSPSVGFRLVEGDELVVAGTWGDAKDMMPTPRLKFGESLSGIVAQTGEVLVVQDPAADPRMIPRHREAVGRAGYRTILGMPVKLGERVLGVLSVRSHHAPGFTEEDIALARALSGHAAIALENARLFQDVQHAYDEVSRTQEQLVHARKMEAIGRLAGGVAHDFNNLLTVITGRAEMLLEQLRPGDRRHREIALIHKTAARAATLTGQLLAFSRRQILAPRVLDLNAVVPGMAAMLQRLIGEDIELAFHPGTGVGRVKADPGQLEQVIVNLVVNARDAMPDGGRITVETADVELDARYARDHAGVQPGPYTLLAVSDTGVGMDAETQARLFEPFFTTKEIGKGTGLGLSAVYGIVTQSGGHIQVYSEPGKGTTFKIYLPRVADAEDPAEAPPVRAGRGTETVLLAEDEDEVRDLAREILGNYGYTVLEARRPVEAIEISGRFPGPIHLLVTDVVMPQMSGRALAERLGPQRPEMKVLFVSGYTDDAIVHHGVLDAGTAFVQKPFTPDSLARKVREVLDVED